MGLTSQANVLLLATVRMTDTRLPTSPRPAATVLQSTLTALADADIPVALVRLPGRDRFDRLEADIAVGIDWRGPAEAVLETLGFRRRPSWGRRPHRFHLRPVVSGDSDPIDWLKIDLVTEFRFGPWHEIYGLGAGTCLSNRSSEMAHQQQLAPEDEFGALLLHVLLDRATLEDDHRDRLLALARIVDQPGVLAERFCSPDSSLPTWDDLVDATRRGNWPLLEVCRPILRDRLLSGRQTRTALRRIANRLLRHSAKVWTALIDRGPLVAVIGPDGTGKTTLTKALVETSGLSGRVLYGGTYPSGTHQSALPGLTAVRVVVRLLHTRVQAAWHRLRGRLVVLDRHPLQVRPQPSDELAPRTWARRWVLAHALPEPDLLVVLDAPTVVLHDRRPEHPPEALASDRERHLRLLDTEPTSHLIDATRTPEAVRGTAIGLIWEHALASREPSVVAGP